MKRNLLFALLLLCNFLSGLNVQEVLLTNLDSGNYLSKQSFYNNGNTFITYQFNSFNSSNLAFKIFNKNNQQIKPQETIVSDNMFKDLAPQIFMDQENQLNFIWYSLENSEYRVYWQKYDHTGANVWKKKRLIGQTNNPHSLFFRFLADGSCLEFKYKLDAAYSKDFFYEWYLPTDYSSTHQKRRKGLNEIPLDITFYDKNHKQTGSTKLNADLRTSEDFGIQASLRKNSIRLFYLCNDYFYVTSYDTAGNFQKTTIINEPPNYIGSYSHYPLGSDIVIKSGADDICVLDSTLKLTNCIKLTRELDLLENTTVEEVKLTPINENSLYVSYFLKETKERKNYHKYQDYQSNPVDLFEIVLDKNLRVGKQKPFKIFRSEFFSSYQILKMANGRHAYAINDPEGILVQVINVKNESLFSTSNSTYSTSIYTNLELLPGSDDQLLMVWYSPLSKCIETNYAGKRGLLYPENTIVSRLIESSVIRQEIIEIASGYCYFWTEKKGEQTDLKYSFIDASFNASKPITLCSISYSLPGLILNKNEDGSVLVLFGQQYIEDVQQFLIDTSGKLVNEKPVILTAIKAIDSKNQFKLKTKNGFDFYYIYHEKLYYNRFINGKIQSNEPTLVNVPEGQKVIWLTKGSIRMINSELADVLSRRVNPIDSTGQIDLSLSEMIGNWNEYTQFANGYLFTYEHEQNKNLYYFDTVSKSKTTLLTADKMKYLVYKDELYLAYSDADSHGKTVFKKICFKKGNITSEWIYESDDTSLANSHPLLNIFNDNLLLISYEGEKLNLIGVDLKGKEPFAKTVIEVNRATGFQFPRNSEPGQKRLVLIPESSKFGKLTFIDID